MKLRRAIAKYLQDRITGLSALAARPDGKDVRYTEYEDGHIGAVAPSLANVEAKIGAAMGGLANRLYVFSGPDAKAQAKLVFRGGPLLKSIEEAFDAGSSTIYAWRVGQTAKASLNLNRKSGDTGIRLVAREAGDYWSRLRPSIMRRSA